MAVSTDQRKTGIVLSRASLAELLQSRGLRLSAVGNSIIGTSSSPFWQIAASKSGGRIILERSTAAGGATSAQMLAQVHSLNTNCNAVLLMEGTNDASQGVTVAQHIANMRAVIQAIRGRGYLPILIAAAPNDAVYSSTSNAMALADRFLAESEGVPFFDPWGRITDTDGTFVAGASTDTVHPVRSADGTVGADLWTLMSAGESGHLLPRSNAGNGLAGSNVLQLTDSNADGLPDGWAALSLTAPTYSLSAEAYPFRGNKCKAVVSQSTTGNLYRIISLGSTAVGDIVRVSGFVSLESSSNMYARVFMRFNGPNQDETGAHLIGDTATQYFSCEGKVPAGTTDIRVFIRTEPQVTGAYSGTVGFGGIDIYNVTQNTY